MDEPKEISIPFSAPLRAAVLLVMIITGIVCIPRAVQAIPREALGLLFFYLLPPGLTAFCAAFVFSYRLRIQRDGIRAEAIPNPFAPAFQCRYADISRVERGSNNLQLDLFRFHLAEPCRIPSMDLLEGGPLRVVEEIRKRIPGDRFFYGPATRLKRFWKGYAILETAGLLSAAGWVSILLLHAGGWLGSLPVRWSAVETALLLAILLMLAAGWLLLRAMQGDS